MRKAPTLLVGYGISSSARYVRPLSHKVRLVTAVTFFLSFFHRPSEQLHGMPVAWTRTSVVRNLLLPENPLCAGVCWHASLSLRGLRIGRSADSVGSHRGSHRSTSGRSAVKKYCDAAFGPLAPRCIASHPVPSHSWRRIATVQRPAALSATARSVTIETICPLPSALPKRRRNMPMCPSECVT